MLSALFSAVGGQIVDKLLGRVTGLFEGYLNKQVSMEELRAGVLKALLEVIGEVEKAQADALARTYASFADALKTSRLLQVMWAVVLGSQVLVLVWHQLGIPALVAVVRWSGHPAWSYPGSGTTSEWAYLLIGGLVGLGPMVLNAGPGAIPLDRIKSLIGR